jgi:hypothetical protein
MFDNKIKQITAYIKDNGLNNLIYKVYKKVMYKYYKNKLDKYRKASVSKMDTHLLKNFKIIVPEENVIPIHTNASVSITI